MSVPMRKRHIDKHANFVWHGTRYSVPLRAIEKYKLSANDEESVPLDKVFGDLIAKHGEPGVLLKGLRAKEGVNQLKFAKTIGVTQANLSAMENGRRNIGKEIAKRIAKKYGVDYRIFL